MCKKGFDPQNILNQPDIHFVMGTTVIALEKSKKKGQNLIKLSIGSDSPSKSYRIHSNATPGFYFSKLVFGRGSIQIWLTWGCIQDGVLLIDSSRTADFSKTLKVLRINKYHFHSITKKSRF